MVHFLTYRETLLSQPLQSLLHTVKPEKDSGTKLIHVLQTPWDGTDTRPNEVSEHLIIATHVFLASLLGSI
jgi:hypothetical protein